MKAQIEAFPDKVLIESDWNLKKVIVDILLINLTVLIESDWNLKTTNSPYSKPSGIGINRIRLEFKGISCMQRELTVIVLIESDWNLKFFPATCTGSQSQY